MLAVCLPYALRAVCLKASLQYVLRPRSTMPQGLCNRRGKNEEHASAEQQFPLGVRRKAPPCSMSQGLVVACPKVLRALWQRAGAGDEEHASAERLRSV